METAVYVYRSGRGRDIDGDTERGAPETIENGNTGSGGYRDFPGLFFLVGLERLETVFVVVANLVDIDGTVDFFDAYPGAAVGGAQTPGPGRACDGMVCIGRGCAAFAVGVPL